MSTAATPDLFAELEAKMAGRVIRPASDGYDAARAVYNGMIDRRPSAIARCSGTADVLEAVNFARGKGLAATIRGGGHSGAGHSIQDDTLMIDLSAMKGVHVDPVRRTARAAGGVTIGEFDRETQVYGLVTTMGTVRGTGIAGLTLGGGVGWLSRRFGYTCDNLLSADVVTADGRVLRVSATENPDLFWGLRGGSGNFGVVTSFEYQLHPLAGMVTGGILVHPREKAREVYDFHREYLRTAPDEVTSHVVLVTSPDGHPITAIGLCYSGAPENADSVVGPLRKFGPPLMDMVGPMPYCAMQSMLDPMMPSGLRNYWTGGYIEKLTDEAVDTMLAVNGNVPSPYSMVLVERHGGAAGRIAPDATAFPHRTADGLLVIMALWKDPAEDEVNIAWARNLWKAMQPFSSGAYSNLLGVDDTGRSRGAFGSNYDRLAALKKKYDPDNFFRFNQNIAPAV